MNFHKPTVDFMIALLADVVLLGFFYWRKKSSRIWLLPPTPPIVFLSAAMLSDLTILVPALVMIVGLVLWAMQQSTAVSWMMWIAVFNFCCVASLAKRSFKAGQRYVFEIETHGVLSIHANQRSSAIDFFRDSSMIFPDAVDEIVRNAPDWCVTLVAVSPWFVGGKDRVFKKMINELERRYGVSNVNEVPGRFSLIKSIVAKLTPKFRAWRKKGPWWRPLDTRGVEIQIRGARAYAYGRA